MLTTQPPIDTKQDLKIRNLTLWLNLLVFLQGLIILHKGHVFLGMEQHNVIFWGLDGSL